VKSSETSDRVQPRAGPWDGKRIYDFLRAARLPVRLGCASESGWPVVLSLWFVWEQGALWCASPSRARVVSYLARDSRCAFQVAGDEPPYRGVRGQARASVEPAHGPRVLRVLVERYLGESRPQFASWLMARDADEVALRIEPVRMSSWDFSDRMGR
jgi:nitroimidazol reductase NimA-like FMN-containing flavoprotein (pyridoxamine 5'-phosphate oxidase superfamily)